MLIYRMMATDRSEAISCHAFAKEISDSLLKPIFSTCDSVSKVRRDVRANNHDFDGWNFSKNGPHDAHITGMQRLEKRLRTDEVFIQRKMENLDTYDVELNNLGVRTGKAAEALIGSGQLIDQIKGLLQTKFGKNFQEASKDVTSTKLSTPDLLLEASALKSTQMPLKAPTAPQLPISPQEAISPTPNQQNSSHFKPVSSRKSMIPKPPQRVPQESARRAALNQSHLSLADQSNRTMDNSFNLQTLRQSFGSEQFFGSAMKQRNAISSHNSAANYRLASNTNLNRDLLVSSTPQSKKLGVARSFQHMADGSRSGLSPIAQVDVSYIAPPSATRSRLESSMRLQVQTAKEPEMSAADKLREERRLAALRL